MVPMKSENAKPLAVEGLVDQHRQSVKTGDTAKFPAALQLVDGCVETTQHLRCLGCAAEHEMNIGGDAQRMLLDACAQMEAPSRGRRSDTVGKEAVSDPREEVLQILGITPCGHDQVLVGGICNERVDAAVGINEAGDDSEPELLFRESLEHLVYRRERVSSGRALGENQDVGLAAIRLREVCKCAARLALCRAGRDIRSPVGKRLQMRVPGDFRQEDFHPQDALQCALDFHVEAGQDRNPAPVIPVLVRIPGIPAAAQRIRERVSRGQVWL